MFVSDVSDIIQRVSGGMGSVMIVAPIEHLDSAVRQRLIDAGLPIGIITGRAQAVAFQLAKCWRALVQTGSPEGAWMVFDAVSSTYTDSFSESEKSLPEPQVFAEILAEVKPTVALVIGHGRGGHAHFNGFVLCGRVRERELGEDSCEIEGGCAWGENGDHFCKLAGPNHPSVITMDELDAPFLLLLTCASGLLPGELFPSDASFAMAAMGRNAVAVLATNRVFAEERCVALSILGDLQKGKGLGKLAVELNERWCKGHGNRPFLVYGDPALSAILKCSPTTTPQWLSPESTDTALASAELVWEQRYERVERAGRFDAAIRRRYSSKLSVDREFLLQLEHLDGLARGVRTMAHSALCLLKDRPNLGDVDEPLSHIEATVSQLMQAWDNAMARLFIDYLFKQNAHTLFLDGVKPFHAEAEESCNYCGSSLTELSHYRRPDCSGRITCPICSACEAWTDGDFRLKMEAPARSGDGEDLCVKWWLRRFDERRPRSCLGHLGFVHNYDHARPKGVAIVDERCGLLHMRVPPESAPRAHHIQLVACQEMRIAVARQFVAILPAGAR